MKRIFGIFSVLSLALVMTAAALGQTVAAPQAKPEHLSAGQVKTLIATAKTPAEHHRIAVYYQAKAADYLAQAAMHEQMVAAYKANPSLSDEESGTGADARTDGD